MCFSSSDEFRQAMIGRRTVLAGWALTALMAGGLSPAQGLAPSDRNGASTAAVSFTCGAALFTNMSQMLAPLRGQELLDATVAATYWVSEAHVAGLSPAEALRLSAMVDRFNPAAVAALAQRCRVDGLDRFKQLPDAEKALIIEMAAASVGSGS